MAFYKKHIQKSTILVVMLPPVCRVNCMFECSIPPPSAKHQNSWPAHQHSLVVSALCSSGLRVFYASRTC